MKTFPLIAGLLMASLPFNNAMSSPLNTTISPEEARDIAEEAYIYFYPLVTMDVTRKVLTSVETGQVPGRGPMNQFHHIRTFPTADMKDVVRPNFDTLYSSAWLDLTHGPVLISTPDTKERYYLLPMLDMWTDVFASPGKRTTGTTAKQYVVAPADWQGKIPAGAERIDAPTPYVWIIGRTQTNGTQDFAAVNSIQNGFTITPLETPAQEPGSPAPINTPNIDAVTPPLDQVNRMPALDYFRYAVELMKLNKPHITDQTLLFRLEKLGIVPGKSLQIVDPIIQNALVQGAADGLKEMQEQTNTIAELVNGWQMNRETMGVYGNSYLKRAIVAMVGLGANLPEDAIYPLSVFDADGQALSGQHRYVLHFNKDELPPVDAFWSITMYDEQGFQVPNPINRFALGDRDALRFNADGSLDIYIQHENPGPELQSNWLPAPEGRMSLTMRLYAPKEEALQGTWNPPSIRRNVEAH
jgi:hypothetical protein